MLDSRIILEISAGDFPSPTQNFTNCEVLRGTREIASRDSIVPVDASQFLKWHLDVVLTSKGIGPFSM